MVQRLTTKRLRPELALLALAGLMAIASSAHASEEEYEEERIGEAASEAASPRNAACLISCAIVSSAGCATVSVACAAGTTFTVGGLTVPCSFAIVAACSVYAGAGTACALLCPA